jgi:hypothetical protein
MSGRGTGTDRRAPLLAVAGLAFYAAFLIASPFEHHDLICHLKTPQHCTSCASSQLGADPHTLSLPGTAHLDDAGSATTFQPIAECTLLTVRSSGRSPPAAA